MPPFRYERKKSRSPDDRCNDRPEADGIASIGLHLPPPAMAVEELASLEPATEAARRALDRWAGPRALAGAWQADVDRDLESRTRIDRAGYERPRD